MEFPSPEQNIFTTAHAPRVQLHRLAHKEHLGCDLLMQKAADPEFARLLPIPPTHSAALSVRARCTAAAEAPAALIAGPLRSARYEPTCLPVASMIRRELLLLCTNLTFLPFLVRMLTSTPICSSSKFGLTERLFLLAMPVCTPWHHELQAQPRYSNPRPPHDHAL